MQDKQDKRKLAIEVDNVQKIYKLYDKPSDRMKEAFGFGKKTKHKLHYALKGVDMKIYQGETVGIIGTNGSGKSTILKIITGVLNPTSGRVLVNGRISALLELGAGFNMEYNGIENVYLNGTMMGFSEKEIEAKLPDILSFAVFFHLDRYQLCSDLSAVNPVDDFPQITISGGMESGLIPQYEFERDIRSGQCQMFHQIRDITALCGRLF